MHPQFRKIVKLGRSTLAITLPKEWVDASKLKQGDYLVVDETGGGSLRVTTDNNELNRAQTVCVINADLCDAPNVLLRMVVGAYLVGHDMIWIQSRNPFKPEHLRELEKVTLCLVGLHVSEQTDSLLVLQSLADPSKPTMDNSIRRLHLVSTFMRQTVVKALTDGRADELTKIEAMGKEGDRIYWLAVRQLLSATQERKLAETLGITSQFWLLGDRAVLSNLKAIVNCTEAMARETRKLLERCFRLETDVVSQITALDDALTDASEGAVSALITRDLARANLVVETIGKLEEEADRIADHLSETVQAPLCRSSILRVICRSSEILSRHRAIAEIAINRALEESTDYASIDTGFSADA